jgi:hypothetical protein
MQVVKEQFGGERKESSGAVVVVIQNAVPPLKVAICLWLPGAFRTRRRLNQPAWFVAHASLLHPRARANYGWMASSRQRPKH